MSRFFKFVGSVVLALFVSTGLLWLVGRDESCGESMHGVDPEVCDRFPFFGEQLTLSIVDIALTLTVGVLIVTFLWPWRTPGRGK